MSRDASLNSENWSVYNSQLPSLWTNRNSRPFPKPQITFLSVTEKGEHDPNVCEQGRAAGKNVFKRYRPQKRIDMFMCLRSSVNEIWIW